MVDVERWQPSAASNDLSPPDGWPEGQAKSTLNNCARENMAATKRLHDKDQWRNPFLSKLGVELYAYSKASDTRIDVTNVDVASAFIAGQRIRIVGAATVTGHVVSASYVNPNTQVTVAIDGVADASLAPGSTQFVASSQRVITTNNVFASAKAGDRIRIGGTALNDGMLVIASVVGSNTVDVTGSAYLLKDETSTPASMVLVNAGGGAVPASPTSINLAGVHAAARGAYKAPGTGELDLLRRVDVQSLAFKAERDLARVTPPNFGQGCAVSFVDGDTFSVGAGTWRDAADSFDLVLSSTLSKNVLDNSAWSAGPAGNAMPSVAQGLGRNADTWYGVFLIGGPGVATDIGLDTSLTAANLLAAAQAVNPGYTKYRRIFWLRTDGSENLLEWVQRGDFVAWKIPQLAYSDSSDFNYSTATLRALAHGAPSCVNRLALTWKNNGSVNNLLVIADAAATLSAAVAEATAPGSMLVGNGSVRVAAEITLMLDASRQIQAKSSTNDPNTRIYVVVHGWIDSRGRDA